MHINYGYKYYKPNLDHAYIHVVKLNLQCIILCIYMLAWIVWHQLQLLCLACMTRCVTKATPFQFIDGNILKSCRIGLTNHTLPISHHIMPLVINVLRSGHRHTQTQTHILTRNQKRFQETWGVRASGLKSYHESLFMKL